MCVISVWKVQTYVLRSPNVPWLDLSTVKQSPGNPNLLNNQSHAIFSFMLYSWKLDFPLLMISA